MKRSALAVKSVAVLGAVNTIKASGLPLASLAVGLKLAHSFESFKLKLVYCEFQQPRQTFIVQKAVTKKTVLNKILPVEEPKTIAGDIWDLVKQDMVLLGFIILTAIGAAIVQLQTPLVTGQLINVLSISVSAAADGLGALTIRDLNGPALKLFGLLTAQGLLTFAHISLVSAFGENVAKRLRAKLFKAIVRQDISFFDCHRSGELVSRLTADVSEFKVTKYEIIRFQTINNISLEHI